LSTAPHIDIDVAAFWKDPYPTLAALRKELNGLVGAWSHRTGQPHGVIHAELRQTCGGPPLPQATADQIQARIATIRRWAISAR